MRPEAPHAANPSEPIARTVWLLRILAQPWLWLSWLSVLPLGWRSLGTPLGEPFADDFFFLRRVLFEGPGSIWDGGGSPVFWRPLGRQAYFAILGSVMVEHPAAVVAVHLVLLAIASSLVYMAVRPHVPAVAAWTAAGFPWLIESGRMLISWPSHFQDVGAIVCSALALLLATRRRWLAMLPALLAALLCKEIGLAAALLMPWTPGTPVSFASRLRASALVVIVALVWGLAYLYAVRGHGVGFEHQALGAGAALPPLIERIVWACRNSLYGVFSLPVTGRAQGPATLIAFAVLALSCTVCFAVSREARTRLHAAAPWVVWGLARYVLASLTLAETYPSWSAQRCVFGAVGLGISLASLLGAAHPLFPVALVALRFALFAVVPLSGPAIAAQPPASKEFDHRQFVRLERIVQGSRDVLQARFPTLPPGSVIGQHSMPQMSEHAFAGSRALQVWYRDSTLRWTRWDQFDPSDPHVVGFVEYQPDGPPHFAIVETAAARGLLQAMQSLRSGDAHAARSELERAERAQRDTTARLFLGITASKRAVAALAGGDLPEAARAANEALVRWPANPDSRYVLAQVLWRSNEPAAAIQQLEDQLARFPSDASARELLAAYRRELGLGR